MSSGVAPVSSGVEPVSSGVEPVSVAPPSIAPPRSSVALSELVGISKLNPPSP
ncbi:MAG: hypothetical protein R3A52_07660 [Polyangiales bacterium]